MGSEADCETTPTPKLSLYSFPSNKAKEPSGMITPPIHTTVSIPFQWEEAPGKPRPYRNSQSESKPNAARCLELPPRLLAEAKVAPSPTTVLEGPDHAGRFVSYNSSFRKGGSFRSQDNKRVNNKEKVMFGSSRWGSFRKAGQVVQGSFDFSTSVVDSGGDAGDSHGAAELKITRVRRRKGSFLSLPQASSHVLDLKNLRSQLYSAAEYFELSYSNDDHKQIVAETLKDYAIKAIVNTIDHLGSVTYEVNDFVEEKVDEVSGTELRVTCIEERLRTCQEYIDHQGISQQSLVINTPKYHKRYILQVGENMHGANLSESKCLGCSLDGEDDCCQFRNAVRATVRQAPPSSVREYPASLVRKGRSPSPSPRPPQRSATFSLTATMPKKELEKRTVSPHRFPRLSSVSVSRPTTPNKSRPSTPNSAGARQRCPSEPRKSASMHLQSEKDNPKDIEQYPSKSKRLLKALLGRRKSKKDEMLYTYLDEY